MENLKKHLQKYTKEELVQIILALHKEAVRKK
jgi:hypothetical protein